MNVTTEAPPADSNLLAFMDVLIASITALNARRFTNALNNALDAALLGEDIDESVLGVANHNLTRVRRFIDNTWSEVACGATAPAATEQVSELRAALLDANEDLAARQARFDLLKPGPSPSSCAGDNAGGSAGV